MNEDHVPQSSSWPHWHAIIDAGVQNMTWWLISILTLHLRIQFVHHFLCIIVRVSRLHGIHLHICPCHHFIPRIPVAKRDGGNIWKWLDGAIWKWLTDTIWFVYFPCAHEEISSKQRDARMVFHMLGQHLTPSVDPGPRELTVNGLQLQPVWRTTANYNHYNLTITVFWERVAWNLGQGIVAYGSWACRSHVSSTCKLVDGWPVGVWDSWTCETTMAISGNKFCFHSGPLAISGVKSCKFKAIVHKWQWQGGKWTALINKWAVTHVKIIPTSFPEKVKY